MQESASNSRNGTRVRLEHLEEDVRDLKKQHAEAQKHNTKEFKDISVQIAGLSSKMNTFQLLQAALALILSAIAAAWSSR